MGVRRRNGERNIHKLKLKEINAARRLFTRSEAEGLIAGGADPSEDRFVNHKNYHVRTKAWVKMGRPLPEGVEEQNTFLATLAGKDMAKVPKDQVPAFVARLRLLLLKEQPPAPPVAEEVPVEASAPAEG